MLDAEGERRFPSVSLAHPRRHSAAKKGWTPALQGWTGAGPGLPQKTAFEEHGDHSLLGILPLFPELWRERC